MRFLLLCIALAWALPGCNASGIGGGDVATAGQNVAAFFPASEGWYWRYNRADSDEVAYLINRGETNPAGESWTTFRLWVGDDYDINNGTQTWDVDLYFIHRGEWYFMGWAANPNGLSQDLGNNLFAGDGVLFASNRTVEGQQWTSEAGGLNWTTTAVERAATLRINELDYDRIWHLRLANDAGNTPFEGDWYLGAGSFPRLELRGWPGLQWDLLHNASTDELLWDFE